MELPRPGVELTSAKCIYLQYLQGGQEKFNPCALDTPMTTQEYQRIIIKLGDGAVRRIEENLIEALLHTSCAWCLSS